MSVVRVLHLEDNRYDAELIERDLRRGGLEVEIEVVSDGEGFETALRERRYDLILADHNLPGYGGREALLQARQHQRDVPFILVTGTLDEVTAVGYMRDGAADFLLKDRRVRLVPAVKAALDEAEHQRQLARHRELLDQVLASALALIYVQDRDGRFILANRAAAEVFDQSVEDLVGRLESEVAPAGEVEQRSVRRLAMLESGEPSVVAEEPYSQPDPEGTRWFQTVRVPLHLSSEPAALALTVATDVTVRRDLEERLRLAERLEAVATWLVASPTTSTIC